MRKLMNWKLLKNLIRNNLFFASFLKYFAGTAATALVAFSVFGLLYYNLYELYLENTLSLFHERNLYRTSAFISTILKTADQDFSLIENDSALRGLLTTPWDKLSYVKKSDVTRIISDLFQRTVLTPGVDSIYVYSEINSYVVTWTEFRSLDSFSDAGFLSGYQDGHLTTAREKWTHTGSPNVITILREINRNGSRLGIAAINFKYDRFAEFVDQALDPSITALSISDIHGSVFYNVGEVREGLYEAAMQNGSAVVIDGGVIYAAVKAPDSSHIVYSAASENAPVLFWRDFRHVAAWSAAIGLGVAFLLSIGVSYRLYRSVIRLVSAIGGPVDEEMDFIATNMTGLARRDKRVEQELAERLAGLKKAQAIALQNQINPHFILNTLQIVSLDVMRQIRGDSTATRIISLLSDILQSNLNTTDYLVPLSYEISQAKKYIEIENIRAQNRVPIEFDIDDPLIRTRTVKFILQPILENSFKHGFVNGKNKIFIRGWKDGKDFMLSIEDNGIGMTEEKLADLQRRLRESQIQENRSIGLCNVDKRIKLVFGEGCGVSVTSAPGGGTTVTIRQKLVWENWR